MMLKLQRMWVQITADRKRFGVLCGAVLVGLLLWSRLIVVSNLPRTAIAEPQPHDAASTSAGIPSAVAEQSEKGAAGLRARPFIERQDAAGPRARLGMSGTTPRAQDPSLSDNSTSPAVGPAIVVALHHLPNHDPFEINSDLFPPRQIENSGQDGEKSPLNPADNPIEAEARLTEQLRSMVNQLTLEAVMKQDVPQDEGGGVPAARVVINAKSYRQGDLVPAPKNESFRFRLSEVNHRSVVLEYEGRMFELKMTSPAGNPARP